MQIKFGKFILADTGDADVVTGKPSSASGLAIDGSRVVQVDELIRGEFISIKDRKNRAKTISFSVTREHKSYGDAERFCLYHDIELPVKAELVILMPRGNGTSLRLTAAEAAVVSVRCSHVGVSSSIGYQIVCGELK